MGNRPFGFPLLVAGWMLGWFLASSAKAQSTLDFGRDIRPLLSNSCFTCHGPDAKQRQAGLRLDQREALFAAAESGQIPVVPGKLEESELWQRIAATDDSQMPPADSEHPLTPEQRARIGEWIQAGASWQEHWAFVAPQQVDLPEVSLESWSQSPIDRLVLARMETAGRTPSPPADRETLLRRVTLDLTGLPPTPEQRQQFLSDTEPGAYHRLVDRLLASPQYGPQMALAWLDAARYADSNGYQNDFGRTMWPWRDQVINALNANQPLDQFITEQLAGDLLPQPSLAQRVASGFNRNNRTVTEGGSIDAEWLVENVVDRVETTSAAFLGLTAGCARCHDHKYDPLSQREFYQLFAFFNNTSEKGVYNELRGNSPPFISVPIPEQQQQLADLRESLTNLDAQLQVQVRQADTHRKAWEDELATQVRNALPAGPPEMERIPSAGKPQRFPVFAGLPDSRYASSLLGRVVQFGGVDDDTLTVDTDYQFRRDQPFTVEAWVRPEAAGAILSRMDQAQDYRGFDLLFTAELKLNVHLIHRWTADAIKITTHRALPRDRWSHLVVTYDGQSRAAGLKIFLDGLPFPFDINNDSLTGDTTTDHPLWLGKRGQTQAWKGQLAGLRIFERELSPAEITDRLGLAESILAGRLGEDWTDEERDLAQRLFENVHSPELIALRNQRSDIQQQIQAIEKQAPTSMVMDTRAERRPTFVLDRGQYDQPLTDQPVSAAVPAFLPPLKPEHSSHLDPGAEPDRLSLARWLVDDDHPLTARVIVNQVWQHHFGQGLHRTPEDFGVQSSRPHQQELLDWLAVDFRKHGWDLKRLHRQIVTSQTYCQSSIVTPEQRAADPENQWLARGPRFRLPAETLRDNALAIAGLINLELGGPPIKPYQPEGLWVELAGGASQGPYRQDTGPSVYRRSIYINRKRTVPPPSMTTFDSGSREVCQVARQRTNTPLQALAMLNDPTYVEAARALASEVLTAESDDPQRLQLAFERAVARPPSPQERATLTDALERYRRHFAQHPQDATEFLQVGQQPANADGDPAELAAWSSLMSLILNLDETLTRE